MWQSSICFATIFSVSLVTIPTGIIAQTAPTPKPRPVPQAPIPGDSCEAKTLINGDRILYRTSYINNDNLRFNGKPVEVDMIKNDIFVAHALTRYAGEFTFTGATATGTRLSFQLQPDKNEITITHGGRTISGKCGDIVSRSINKEHYLKLG